MKILILTLILISAYAQGAGVPTAAEWYDVDGVNSTTRALAQCKGNLNVSMGAANATG